MGVTKEEFQTALQSGLGRARQFARTGDVQPFRDAILDACLHCYAVDLQCEGTRAGYMLELIELCPDRQFFRTAILESLTRSDDDWNAVQRFRMAIYMAMDGDAEARRLAYDNYNPGPKCGGDVAVDFVRLDGIAGLLFAAERLGSMFEAMSVAKDDGWLLSHAKDTLGETETMQALRAAAETNSSIARYLEVADRPSKPQRNYRSLSWPELQQRLAEFSGHHLGYWGKQASVADLEAAALSLLQATREARAKLLPLFNRIAFPLDPTVLFELAGSADDQIALEAARALSQVEDQRVRQLAFKLVDQNHASRSEAIAMLDCNFDPGDHQIALDWLQHETDAHIKHSFELDVRNLWDHHPGPTTEVPMLLALYEHGPCSKCREFIVSRLIALHALPDELREECRYDANHNIRYDAATTIDPEPAD